MTTNFNFVTDNGFTTENFAKVCVKMEEGMRLFEQTQIIYNFLLEHKGKEFSPTEIGLTLGKPFAYHYSWDNTDEACVKKISDSLYWLFELGLINRNTYTKNITIELPYRDRVRDVKIINGVEYVGYIDKGTKEITSTSYKWFAL